jgi:hypothetical protein
VTPFISLLIKCSSSLFYLVMRRHPAHFSPRGDICILDKIDHANFLCAVTFDSLFVESVQVKLLIVLIFFTKDAKDYRKDKCVGDVMSRMGGSTSWRSLISTQRKKYSFQNGIRFRVRHPDMRTVTDLNFKNTKGRYESSPSKLYRTVFEGLTVCLAWKHIRCHKLALFL